MKIDLQDAATFGVAGNFTGHLEQAGVEKDFALIKTREENAPKGIFPTYIPCQKDVPEHIRDFPFSSSEIMYPEGEEKIQLEPECAVLFNVSYENGKIKELSPVAFTASNDCSIRKSGSSKVSEKKNWGKLSKGLSENFIPLESFSSESSLDDYKIASFLIRNGKVLEYGEDSFVRDYSYIYEKLTSWLIETINTQKDEGPMENVLDYLKSASCPSKILVSVGATRYTDFGKETFLRQNDELAVVLYPSSRYTVRGIEKLIEENGFAGKDEIICLWQKIVIKK